MNKSKKSKRQDRPRLDEGADKHSRRGVETLILLGIFVLAFSVRLFYLFQIESIPLFYHLAGDARIYDEWAQRIAGGDWLGREVFYQAPLYPYFLGLLEAIFGHDLWWIRVVQIALGSASCVLIYWVGKSLFSKATGVAAGLILSLYAPAIYFDALIQKAVLDLSLVALLIFLLSKANLRPHWVRWGTIGVVLGLLTLSRENALVWVFVVPIWIWVRFAEHSRRIVLGWIGIFLAGVMLVLLPVGMRNLMVGGEFTLTTSQLGPNFFIGNNPGADGTHAPLRAGRSSPQYERQDATEIAEQALGRSLLPGEVSGYWLRRSWDFVRSQPLEWIWLLGKKWLMVWNVRELEDTEDFYVFQEWSWLLRILGWINLGLLAPLAAIGVVLTWRQRRELWLLYLLLVTFALSVALFFIFARYRALMVPLLVLFAGAAAIKGFALCRERRVREGVVCVGVLVLTALLVHWPVAGKPGPSAAGYYNLGGAFAKQGRTQEAIDYYQRALQVQPHYSMPHYTLGEIFAKQGRFADAVFHYQEAIRIDPDFAEAHNNLGNILLGQEDFDRAIQHYLQALKLNPGYAQVPFNLARALVQQNQIDAAIVYFQQALKIKPDFVEVHNDLGSVLARKGQLQEAIEQFSQAVRINPNYALAHANLGNVLARRGELEKAIVHFRDAVRIQPNFAEAHESLAKVLALQGKTDDAIRHHQEALRIKKDRAGIAVSP